MEGVSGQWLAAGTAIAAALGAAGLTALAGWRRMLPRAYFASFYALAVGQAIAVDAGLLPVPGWLPWLSVGAGVAALLGLRHGLRLSMAGWSRALGWLLGFALIAVVAAGLVGADGEPALAMVAGLVALLLLVEALLSAWRLGFAMLAPLTIALPVLAGAGALLMPGWPVEDFTGLFWSGAALSSVGGAGAALIAPWLFGGWRRGDRSAATELIEALHDRIAELQRQLGARDTAFGAARQPSASLPPWAMFIAEGGHLLAQARRYGRPLTLLLIEINDADRLPVEAAGPVRDQLAAAIGELLRDADISSLIDERSFAVLLPETDRIGAAGLADRVSRTLAARRFQLGGGEIALSVSVACTAMLERDDRIEALLARARHILDQDRMA